MLDEVVRVLTNIIVLVAWPGPCDNIIYIIMSSCSPNERGTKEQRNIQKYNVPTTHETICF